jgi:hypothetical protein
MSSVNDNVNIKEWADCYVNKTSKLVSLSMERLAILAEQNNPVQFFKFYIESIEADIKQLKVNQFVFFLFYDKYF